MAAISPASAISDPLTPVSFRGFLTDPKLLGPDFGAASWKNWRIILAAALGEPLTADETAAFIEIAGRPPPSRRVSELWLAIGRRGGKDSAISALAAYLAVFGNFAAYLRRGEVATVICLAVDKVQAAIIFRYIRAYFEQIPLLKFLLKSANNGVVELTNNIEIVILSSNFRSIRGRSIACCIFDELAFWRDENFANPDTEIFNAAIGGLLTLKRAGALIVAISTVYRKIGLLFEKITAYAGKADDDVLSILAPSITFNPTLREPAAAAEIERLRAEDPERAAAEFDSVWRSDISGFIDRAIAEALIDRGVCERPPQRQHHYTGFLDLAGGSGADAMAFSIAHREGDVAVQDVLRHWRPPFDVAACLSECAALADNYRISTIIADNWGAGLAATMARRERFTLDQSARPKTKVYLDFLALANSGKVRLVDDQTQFRQLLGLERRVRFGGGETIDHMQNGHDDAINASAGALTLAAAKSTSMILSPMALRRGLAAMPVRNRFSRSSRLPHFSGRQLGFR